jgi:hypothetical protein
MRETTKCERAAMWMYGHEYALAGIGAIEFWRRLDERRKDLIRDMVRQLDACEVFE